MSEPTAPSEPEAVRATEAADAVAAAESAESAEAADAGKVAALRAVLPATRAGIYLNTGTSGPLPAETAAAMREIEDRELALGRGTMAAYEELKARMDEARAAMAAVLGTEIDAVALTHSTTEGMNLAIGTVDWQPGDRVLTTNLEHPGVTAPLAAIHDRHGVEVVVADIGDGGDADATLATLEHELRAGGVKMVALSHIAWSTGAVLPVARIAELGHEHGALVAIDGAQGAGAVPVDFDALGADFYAASGQKWLLGPEGTGALAVALAARELIPLTRGYFSFGTPHGVGREFLWPNARRFESGGIHKPSVAGLARSVGWLAMFVDLEWAMARAARLARSAADRLAATPGVELVTPRASMGTLVTFRVAGWTAEAVMEELSKRIFAIVRTLPGWDAVRLSVGFFTTEAELRRVLDTVELIASHTPETLPVRPATEFAYSAGL